MTDNLILELKEVEIKQQQSTILENISLKVSKGEFVYIVGKTGSGKRSLLTALYGDV